MIRSIKRARRLMAKALKDNPQFRWDWQEVIARTINEDQRALSRADLKSFPSTFILAGKIIEEIFK